MQNWIALQIIIIMNEHVSVSSVHLTFFLALTAKKADEQMEQCCDASHC